MQQRNKKKRKKRIQNNLRRTLKEGALLYLDGELAAPSRISSAMVREEGSYMADYITDVTGYVTEIHYDRVRD